METSPSNLQGNSTTQTTMEPNNAASQAMNNVRQYPETAKVKEELLNSQGSSEYQTPRMFAKNSKLHSYLAKKSPNVVRLEKHCYTLYEVLLALKEIVSREKLFDRRNPTLIICNSELEDALEMKALHITEIKNQVLKHFLSQEKIIESKSGPNSKLTENIETTTVPVGPDTDDRYVERKNIPYCHNQNVGISCQQSPQRTSSQSMRIQTQELKEHANACPTAMKENIKETLIKEENSYQVRFSKENGESDIYDASGRHGYQKITTMSPTVDAGAIRIDSSTSSSQDSSIQSEARQLDMKSSNSQSQLSRDVPFELDGNFMINPVFLEVIRKVNGVDPRKTIFTYKELTNYLSQYILQNRSKFFDKRNHMVAICEGDILAEAFGVRAFHRSQVTGLLRSQLIPCKDVGAPQISKMDNINRPQPDGKSSQASHEKGPSRKRCTHLSTDDDTEEESGLSANKIVGTDNSASYQFVKRQRRRTSSRDRSRSISITVATFDYSSSGDETIYSAQGYETVAVGDMEDLASEEESDTSNLDDETRETIRAQAAAAAADAIAEEQIIHADTPDSNDSSDNVFNIEDVYQVEFEPESDTDTEIDETPNGKGKKKSNSLRFSDSDTDLEDAIFVAAATLFEFTDFAEWADSSDTDPSDSGIETPVAISKDANASNQHHESRGSSDESVETSARPIKCISCDHPDESLLMNPLMKECHSCWQERRKNMPDRPKPRRRKNKGKGKNSNGSKISKANIVSLQRNNSFPLGSGGSRAQLPHPKYHSDHTTSSHTSSDGGSSQEMVMEVEVSKPNIVKRPSLNRSFSENYDTNPKKQAEQIDSVTSIQSDGDEHKNTGTNLINNLKSKEKSFSMDSIQSTTGSTGSIDSQKSCDSGFVEIELQAETTDIKLQTIRQEQDSFDEVSEALDTEDDTASPAFSKNRKRNTLGHSTSLIYKEPETKYPGKTGCEIFPTSIDHKPSLEVPANNGTLCNICNERPKDACFVHQKISHQYACYRCSKKQYRINPVCPVCRRKVEKITRNILA